MTDSLGRMDRARSDHFLQNELKLSKLFVHKLKSGTRSLVLILKKHQNKIKWNMDMEQNKSCDQT